MSAAPSGQTASQPPARPSVRPFVRPVSLRRCGWFIPRKSTLISAVFLSTRQQLRGCCFDRERGQTERGLVGVEVTVTRCFSRCLDPSTTHSGSTVTQLINRRGGADRKQAKRTTRTVANSTGEMVNEHKIPPLSLLFSFLSLSSPHPPSLSHTHVYMGTLDFNMQGRAIANLTSSISILTSLTQRFLGH